MQTDGYKTMYGERKTVSLTLPYVATCAVLIFMYIFVGVKDMK